MPRDFIPHDNDDLVTWLTAFKQFLDDHGTELGLTSARVTALKAKIDGYIVAHGDVEITDNAKKGAVANRKTLQADLLPDVRDTAADMKRSTAYTPALGQIGGIVGAPSSFDRATFKTKLTFKIEGNKIIIDFTKSETDGIRVYARLRGELGWTFLATDTNTPYYDTRPLAVAGHPETREYMARGVIKDEEIGLDSDIITVVFNG